VTEIIVAAKVSRNSAGDHVPALLFQSGSLPHLILPEDDFTFFSHGSFTGSFQGEIAFGGFSHSSVKFTAGAIKIVVADLEINDSGFHPNAVLFGVGDFIRHNLFSIAYYLNEATQKHP
jgi:hypothetical protein